MTRLNLRTRAQVLCVGIALLAPGCGPEKTTESGNDDAAGSGGASEAGSTDTSSSDSGPTPGSSAGDADFVPDANCVELNWSCESDDRVCIPRLNQCALCAPLGQNPQDFAGHCCQFLVQNADRDECIETPPTDSCIPDGGISGHSGIVQGCCVGTAFDPATDLCEPVPE